ncbi:MAG: hypothetical protein K2Q14_08440 [Gammaproteobacteria bacterium]|nr:hypothetical protein [Gammaproteobacteria bacterium]
MTNTSLFENFDIVYSYTRAQAIDDGVLVDVSSLAQEAGFIYPVAVTAAVYDKYIDWTEEDNKRQTYQDVKGRLWDILSMMRLQKSRISHSGRFEFMCIPRGSKSRRVTPINVTLKALCHGGDKGEPVITVMLPNED